MGLSTLLAQTGTPTSAWDMVFGGTLLTRAVLLVLAVSSTFSWVLIFWKAKQFRAVRRQGTTPGRDDGASEEIRCRDSVNY